MKAPATTRRKRREPVPTSKAGQALLESFGIIVLLCFILFGIVQYSLSLAATEVVQYSADAAVRARAVGFNRFMVYKVTRVASIPNAGKMRTPNPMSAGNAAAWYNQSAGQSYYQAMSSSPRSQQYHEVEQYNIPLYLGADYYGRLPGILDYDEWDTVSGPIYTGIDGDEIGVVVRQDFPLKMPFARAFSRREDIRIRKEARLADHASYYLE